MCHNAIIGHGGADRTITKLISLAHNWPYMRQHVKAFIRQCPCCQKMDNVRVPIHVHHYVTSSYTPFEVLNIVQYRLRRSLSGRRPCPSHHLCFYPMG
jgi:Integrase zinc binding domain